MPEPSPSSIDALLEQCILALENGASVDAILDANPDAAPALRERIDHLAALGILQAPKSSAAIPERLGDFRLLRQIGRGGMGIVYLAEQIALQRNVALKLVHPEQLFFGGARERFRREILAVARLQHAGIVPILTCGEAEGIPFYAMELVHGASIGEVLVELAGTAPDALAGPSLRGALHRAMAKKKELEGVQDAPVFQGAWSNVCCRLVRDAAEALQHAHDQGVLHRDIKPSNLLLTATGQVRLIDFGLASARGEQRLTRSGATLGSLPYMAPEQVRGDLAQVDARTDVYALGVALYELLTLALPHGDGSGDTRERILAGHVEPPSRKNGFVHPDAEAVCLMAMDPDPARRYRTAAAFAEDLQAFLEHRTVAARRPSWTLRARRWARRNPMRAATAIVAFVVLVPGPLALAVQQNIAAGHLEQALHDVEEQRRLAQQHLAEARSEEQRAQTNFDNALRAVDLMLLRTSEARLVHQPRTAALRRQLLQDAVTFHENLIATGGARPGDQRPQEQHARSLSRLGALQAELGNLDKSLALLLESKAELEALLPTAQNPEAQQGELANTWDRLATVYARKNRFEEAEAALRRNMEILDSLLARSPTPKLLESSINAQLTLAVSMQRQQRGDEALQMLDEIEKRLAAPNDLVVLDEATRTKLSSTVADNRGIVLARTGETDRAMQSFATALQRLDSLPADAREAPTVVAERAGILQRLGLIANQRRDWETARPYLDRACADYQKLLEDEPNFVRWPQNYARVLSTRAANLHGLGRLDEAGPDHDRAVAVLEKACATAPQETQLPVALAIAYAERASYHQLRRSHREALHDFGRAIELFAAGAAADPGDDLTRSNLAAALANQADSLVATGDIPKAQAAQERALEIIRACPGPEARRSLVELLGATSDLAMRTGDATRSLAMMDEAMQIARELLADAPNDRVRQMTFGFISLNHGTARVNANQLPRAIEIWEAAVPVLRPSARELAQARTVLGVMLMRLADICDRLGKKDAAFAWFDEAIATTGMDSDQLAPYQSLVELLEREEFSSRLPPGHPDR